MSDFRARRLDDEVEVADDQTVRIEANSSQKWNVHRTDGKLKQVSSSVCR